MQKIMAVLRRISFILGVTMIMLSLCLVDEGQSIWLLVGIFAFLFFGGIGLVSLAFIGNDEDEDDDFLN